MLTVLKALPDCILGLMKLILVYFCGNKNFLNIIHFVIIFMLYIYIFIYMLFPYQ